MNTDLGKSTWSPREIEDLRDIVRGVISGDPMPQAEVARQSQVPASTLSQFLSGKYQGDSNGIATQLSRWLDSRNREREILNTAPPEPTFVMTPTANHVMAALAGAHVLGELVLITGVAGVGKTAAAQQYEATTPRVFSVTASPAKANLQGLLAHLLERYGWKQAMAQRSKWSRAESVRQMLPEGALLIVDEAQHCTIETLEELRAIHDERRCGLVLMGNATVITRINGGEKGKDPAYAMLWSRVGHRLVLDKGRPEDVAPVLATMGITQPDVLDAAGEIAKRENLRTVVRAARKALMLANASRENLEPKHLQAAYRQNVTQHYKGAA